MQQTAMAPLQGHDPDGVQLLVRLPSRLQHIPDILDRPINTIGRLGRCWSGVHLGRELPKLAKLTKLADQAAKLTKLPS